MSFAPLTAETLSKLPIDSARKYAAAVVRVGDKVLTLVKGAPEVLMPYVTACLDGQGTTVPIDRNRVSTRIRQYASAGERVLMLCVHEGECDVVALERGELPPRAMICALTLADR